MNTADPLFRHTLADGTQVEIHDATSHYFGGYYHVRLDLRAQIRIRPEWFEHQETYEQACRRLGSAVTFRRSLDRMAVPDAELESVRRSLLETFEKNMLTYLQRPDFSRRFVLAEHARTLRTPAPSRCYHRG